MKTKLIVILMFFSFVFVYGQILQNESIKGNIYELNIQNNINFSINRSNDVNNIIFDNYFDESLPGSFCLPSMDLFIAIPGKSAPKVEIIDDIIEFVNAIPKINPIVEKLNDSTLVYTETNFNFKPSKNYEILGFTNIDKNYCIHIKYNPFRYNFANRQVEIVKTFKLKLIFDQKLTLNNTSKLLKHPIILNPSFGSNYYIQPVIDKPNSSLWIDFNKTYLKLGVIKDDIYRINKNDLLNYNIGTVSINPKTFKIFVKGIQIPIFVYGENDNSFDDSDYIEFFGIRNYGDKNYREPAAYGEPYKEYLDRYSDTTAYWLTWDGEEGQRIDSTTNFSNVPSDTLDFYDEFLHFEQNPWFDYALDGGSVRREDPNWHENETWNWWGQSVGTVSQSFTTTNVYPNRVAHGYAKFQSWATNLSTNSHITALKINNYNTVYDSGYVQKYEVKTLKAEFSSSLLINGTNYLRIVSYATQSTVNRLFGDWREIEYPRYLLAKNDTLTFRYTSLNEEGTFGLIKLGNVNSNDNIIYKYLGNYNFKKITNFTKNGSTINFIDTVRNNDQYILRTSQTVKKPIFYYKKHFDDLLNTQNQAEYVLITHPFFLDKANEYANMISSSYNITTKVINVFDIYDLLNYGFFAPEPIKDFLKAAYNNWQTPKIKNVFIVGRSNYDYYGYKTKYQGAPIERCLVPSFGAPVSDTWYVIWDEIGTSIPQINIGRLPARNIAEFENYMLKHQNYINSNFDNWNKKFLFFSGGNFTDPNQINTLKGINDYIIDNYVTPRPIGGDAIHFYKTADPITNFGPYSPSFIQEKIDNGGLLISYLGHSGTQTWDNSITDPIQLRNLVNRSPFITDFGCSTARFAEPDITSFSELFVNGLSGQAIGYIGNSSLGFTSTSYTAPKLFYEKLLVDTVLTLGDAHRLTKLKLLSTYGSTGTYRLFALTNSLVGDPIIKIKLPAKPNLLISNSNIKILGNLSDDVDSVLCKIVYFNSGLATIDTFKIKIQHFYNSQIIKEESISKVLPLFSDSLQFYIKTKNLTGEHRISINLDSENKIEEIYENDNELNTTVNIFSSSFRSLFVNPIQNQVSNSICFINSTNNSNSNRIKVKIAKNADFSGSDSTFISLGTIYTKINLYDYSTIDRLWLKARPEFGTEYGVPISFLIGSKNSFILSDSISYIFERNVNLSYNSNSVILDTLRFNLYALSAGYNAGRTAIIAINGQNLIPENTLRGFNICRFDKNNLSFIEYKRFDISSGVAANNLLIAYLDSITVNEIVVISVSDDAGESLTSILRNKLKEFGSSLITNFGVRYSWALIGYKGAPIGSVPEGLKAPFDGKVEIDTTITRMPLSGGFVTSELGPVSKWKEFEVNQSIPDGASIKYRILGVTDSNTIDTLENVAIDENGLGDISSVDAKKYPKIKVKSDFSILPGSDSPSLRSLSVGYDKLPELATNYQVVSVSKDSIDQGGSVTYNFGFMNVGGSSADSFKVLANLILPNNTKRVIFDSLFTQLDTMILKSFNYSYASNFNDGFGNMAFELIVDSINKVKELYKDNNYYKVPFYVIKDTVTNIHSASVSTKFDDIDIADGDFVSSRPVITINLDYLPLFPYEDTTAFRFYIDGVRKYRNEIDSSVFDTINRKITYYYKPILQDGEHFIRITGTNIIGNLENGYQKNFVVSSEAKVLNVYNYPNPFAENTYFTFKLTQIPDEITINIYTVAGRLIKKININGSELNIDFNRVFWDGKDEDGDEIANGVYFYKMIMKANGKTETITQKFAKVK